jgi:hypothetical protein
VARADLNLADVVALDNMSEDGGAWRANITTMWPAVSLHPHVPLAASVQGGVAVGGSGGGGRSILSMRTGSGVSGGPTSAEGD